MQYFISSFGGLALAFSLLAISARASQWETFNSGVGGISLSFDGSSFGGVFTRSTLLHYVGDTRLGGRVRRPEPLSASGHFRFTAQAGFNTAVRLGHFASDGEISAFTEFAGIRFQEYSAGKLRAQACIQFDLGAVRQGPSIVLPAGEYAWSYEWIPNGGAAGLGLLRATFTGAVSGVSEVSLTQDSSTYYFACNAFGLQTGFAPTAAPQSAEIVVSNAIYTTLQTPPLTDAHTRVFFLIGQSNARGKDPSVGALALVKPRLNDVDLWVDPIDQFAFAEAPSESRNYFGPEITLGHDLAEALQEPVAIIKVTLGGRSLEEEWLPELQLSYRRLTNAARLAMQQLHDPIPSGLFSVQGETDSGAQASAEHFAQNLRHVHESLQRDLNAPNFPLVISRLMPFITTSFRDTVRAQQEQFNWVNTDDLGNIGDSLHYNGAALVEIGHRFAGAWIATAKTPFFWTNGRRIGILCVPGTPVEIERSTDLSLWNSQSFLPTNSFTELDFRGPNRFFRFPKPKKN